MITAALLVFAVVVLFALVVLALTAFLVYITEVGWPWPLSAYGRLLDRLEARGRAKRAKESGS